MTLVVILLIGAFVGLLTGALLRRVGAITRLLDLALGLVGAFVAGALGSSALLTGLTREDLVISAIAPCALVLLAHIGSAVIRPVHAKYYGKDTSNPSDSPN